MTTFVLVHGAWHGGWCWRHVADMLRAQGHQVFTPTMTGVGERSHLLHPNIDLDTQIADIVNLMKWEGLEDVVLCGHSYGGFVISGVAEIMQSALSSIVYLDAFFPDDGQSVADLADPEQAQIYTELVSAGMPIVPVPAAVFNVNEKDRAWVDSRCTAHPSRCFTQKIALTGARDRIARRTYILATDWVGFFAPFHERLKSTPGWQLHEMPCGHDAMIDMPKRLAEILIQSSVLGPMPG
jgi:pimeloyl-ACP methyl ester carboxylesterase